MRFWGFHSIGADHSPHPGVLKMGWATDVKLILFPRRTGGAPGAVAGGIGNRFPEIQPAIGAFRPGSVAMHVPS